MSINIRLKKEAESANIYLYPRGWYYKLTQKLDPPYNFVERGQHVNVFMNIQATQKLAKKGIYKYTASNKQDCINDPTYDLDKIATQKVHQKFNATYGCVLPIFGGVYKAERENYRICTNTSLYTFSLLQNIYKGIYH